MKKFFKISILLVLAALLCGCSFDVKNKKDTLTFSVKYEEGDKSTGWIDYYYDVDDPEKIHDTYVPKSWYEDDFESGSRAVARTLSLIAFTVVKKAEELGCTEWSSFRFTECEGYGPKGRGTGFTAVFKAGKEFKKNYREIMSIYYNAADDTFTANVLEKGFSIKIKYQGETETYTYNSLF